MFDLGWAELLIVAVVALIIVGPKDLPGALRTVTGFVRQARSMAREFQRGIDEIARDSGIQDIKRDLQKSVDLGLDDDIKDALSPDFDDHAKPSSGAQAIDPPDTTDPTGGNAILSPESAKLAAEPMASSGDTEPLDPGPEETPRPDIVTADDGEASKIVAGAPKAGGAA